MATPCFSSPPRPDATALETAIDTALIDARAIDISVGDEEMLDEDGEEVGAAATPSPKLTRSEERRREKERKREKKIAAKKDALQEQVEIESEDEEDQKKREVEEAKHRLKASKGAGPGRKVTRSISKDAERSASKNGK